MAKTFSESKSLIGLTFGSLKVVSHRSDYTKKCYWNCECSCGEMLVVVNGRLVDGDVKACRKCIKAKVAYNSVIGVPFKLVDGKIITGVKACLSYLVRTGYYQTKGLVYRNGNKIRTSNIIRDLRDGFVNTGYLESLGLGKDELAILSDSLRKMSEGMAKAVADKILTKGEREYYPDLTLEIDRF